MLYFHLMHHAFIARLSLLKVVQRCTQQSPLHQPPRIQQRSAFRERPQPHRDRSVSL